MVEYFTVVPAWVLDWSSAIALVLALVLLAKGNTLGWVLYLVSTIPSLLIYFVLENWLLAVFQLVYIGVAVYGYTRWRRQDKFLQELDEKKGMA